MATRLTPTHRARVDRALAAGDPAPARPHHAALAGDGTPAGLLYRLAMLEARAGAAGTAVRLLEAARSRAPGDADLLANLVELVRLIEQYQSGALVTWPASAHSLTSPAVVSGISSYSPSSLGSPALG